MGEDMKKTIVIVYDKAVISGGAAKIAIQSAIELAKNPNNNAVSYTHLDVYKRQASLAHHLKVV